MCAKLYSEFVLSRASGVARVDTAGRVFGYMVRVWKESLAMRKDGAAFRNALIVGGTIIALVIVGVLLVNYIA